MRQTVEFTRLDSRASLPTQAYPDDAGWDLAALETVRVPVGARKEVRTGLAIAIPAGYYGRVTGRSSTIRKMGIFVYEGVADAGFRGEWTMHVENRSWVPQVIEGGQYIAQLIISPFQEVEWQEVPALVPTVRGERGYGSSSR